MIYVVIGVVLVLLIGGLVIWVVVSSRALDRYIKENSETVPAWVIPLPEYTDVEHSFIYTIIFTFDDSIPDNRTFLEEVADRIMELPGNEKNKKEREVTRWMAEQPMSWELLRFRKTLPKSLTEGRVVHCQNMYAKKELVPDDGIPPYVLITVVRDAERWVNAKMVEALD